LDKADSMIIGGAMAYTFGLALGKKVGKSLTEPDKVNLAQMALQKAKIRGVKLLLPVDTLITDKLDFPNAQVGDTKVVEGDIPDGWEGVDIGPKSIALFNAEIARSKTILWNGPMGVFEIKACAQGTFAMAKAIAENSGAISIIGGGDSVKAMKKSGHAAKVSFISTGGGASLEFLEGAVLPGVSCLESM
ncbi:MAG TPA: phosphoglycerate kinase, partial [Opitutales bacterium]|nr:phosphoglycerate kinase [Opitutales bacterium]